MATHSTAFHNTLKQEAPGTTGATAQYGLLHILGIWAAAALPMGILGWVVAPALAPDISVDPIGAAVIRLGALTLGLIWLWVLSLIMVYREAGNLRWTTIRQRLWLNTPRDPHSGAPRRALWLWLIPLVILVGLWHFSIDPFLDQVWIAIVPFLAEPAGYGLGSALASPEVQAKFVGAWGILALFVVNAVFNTFLGEEFLFRGVLLPRMKAVFGKWDWLANGVLFGLYHLHQPWGILGSIGTGVFLYALPARRFRSTWISIVVHSAESVYFLFLLLGLVLGLG